ncbi:hypothetical protein KCV01_g10239, partial [Aureobasidium melanogenum]
MAADYLAQIRGVQKEGPYYLLGWSLGCHIAQAMATLLQEQGEEVGLLVMMDGYPIDDPVERATLRQALSEEERLGTEELMRQYLDEVGMLHLLGDMEASFFEGFMRQLESAPELLLRFNPNVYEGDMLFFRATIDEKERPSALGWKRLVTGRIQVCDVACKHHAMMQRQALEQIGPVLDEALSSADGVIAKPDPMERRGDLVLDEE